MRPDRFQSECVLNISYSAGAVNYPLLKCQIVENSTNNEFLPMFLWMYATNIILREVI